MYYKIRLNDNTEFHARFCSERKGLLTVGIETEATFLTVAQKFSEAAACITFIYDTTEERHIGFTKLVTINSSVDGEYEVTLRKE